MQLLGMVVRQQEADNNHHTPGTDHMSSLWTDGTVCNRMCMPWPNIDTVGKPVALTAMNQVRN